MSFKEFNQQRTSNLHGAHSATVRENIVLEDLRHMVQKLVDKAIHNRLSQVNVLKIYVDENTTYLETAVQERYQTGEEE